MIRWCSYCQKFLGEVIPFDDFSVTHGICERCRLEKQYIKISNFENIQKISEFFSELKHETIVDKELDLQQIFRQGALLGINNIDLCMGIIQPLLYDIGIKWKLGQVSVAQEHRFTKFSQQIIRETKRTLRDHSSVGDSYPSPVLLVCADGNYHTLGIQMIELIMIDFGLRPQVFVPGLPNDEIVNLVAKYQPKLLGISVALQEQFASVPLLAETLYTKGLTKNMQIVVGGTCPIADHNVLGLHEKLHIAPKDIGSLKSLIIKLLNLKDYKTAQ